MFPLHFMTEISRTLIIIHNNTQTNTHTSSIIQQNSLFFSAVFAAFCGSSICVQGFKPLFLFLALLSLNPCVQRLWEYQRIYTSAQSFLLKKEEGEKGVESSIKSLLSPRMSVLALRDECAQSEKDKFKKREKEKSHRLNLSMCHVHSA